MNSQRVLLTTADGDFTAALTERGLAGLDFPRGSRTSTASIESLPPQTRKWAQMTARALGRALAGKTLSALPPLDESEATDFQRAVWQALRAIPAGSTRSYAEIAASVGRPRAFRAVGQACGANPIPVLTPCHRAVATGGGLGGFSGGLEWKRRLLERERQAA